LPQQLRPRPIRPRARRRPWTLVAACAALLLPAAAGAGWTTNEASLDTGLCGRNLQAGAERTASVSATPTFLLQGDGGASSYAVAIDGRRLGTFTSRGDAVVCIPTRTALDEGRHVLTGTELAPNAGTQIRLAFSVDTRAPRPPTRPVLSAHTDTGARGDGITASRSVNLHGRAAPNEPVQITANGRTVVAGAATDARGRWSATTVPLGPGTYLFTAATLDRAGNRSAPSPAVRVTIQGPG
jgi:hypothetical protein